MLQKYPFAILSLFPVSTELHLIIPLLLAEPEVADLRLRAAHQALTTATGMVITRRRW